MLNCQSWKFEPARGGEAPGRFSKENVFLADEPGTTQQPPVSEVINGEPDKKGKYEHERTFGLVLLVFHLVIGQFCRIDDRVMCTGQE